MKKTSMLLKTSFAVVALIIFSNTAFSQGTEFKTQQIHSETGIVKSNPVSGKNNNPSNLRGGSISPGQAKIIVQQASETGVMPDTKSTRNCTSQSAFPPNSISRKNFNNLPQNRQQFLLNNPGKYTIVD